MNIPWSRWSWTGKTLAGARAVGGWWWMVCETWLVLLAIEFLKPKFQRRWDPFYLPDHNSLSLLPSPNSVI
jgi:hypothetical protein